MGLASASSAASWRTRGGTSGGAEAAMVYLTAHIAVRTSPKIKAPAKVPILLTYALMERNTCNCQGIMDTPIKDYRAVA
jgi:hypothetical protein